MVTTAERVQATADTKVKLSLEKELEKELKKWNKKLSDTFINKYPLLQLPTVLSEELESILTSHHLKVAERFAKVDLKKGVVKQAAQEINRIEVEVSKKVLAYIEKNSVKNIESIKKTTEEAMSIVIRKAHHAALAQAQEGEILSAEEIALIAWRLLKKRLDNRLPVIGVTETNWPAEGTRNIQTNAIEQPLVDQLRAEAAALEQGSQELAEYHSEIALGISKFSNSVGMIEAGETSVDVIDLEAEGALILISIANNIMVGTKTWVTMGDNRVRDTHQLANGQKVQRNSPFLVGGELLMFPTDQSLGAAANNTIGCRCYASYS